MGEAVIIVDSGGLQGKIKALLQEDFHKTVSMGKELTAQGSELTC